MTNALIYPIHTCFLDFDSLAFLCNDQQEIFQRFHLKVSFVTITNMIIGVVNQLCCYVAILPSVSTNKLSE